MSVRPFGAFIIKRNSNKRIWRSQTDKLDEGKKVWGKCAKHAIIYPVTWAVNKIYKQTDAFVIFPLF